MLRPLRRRHPVLVLLSVLFALAAAAPAQAAGVGAVADLTWGISRADVDREVALMRDANVRWVRINASWIMLEPAAKGQLDAGGLATTDYAVDAANKAGLKVLMPISDGVPYWASADPAKTTVNGTRSWNKLWKPLRWSDYADIVRTVVDRYRQRGVHYYEIWNEPNHPHFWPSGVNAAEYVEMLKAGSAAVRATDPEATVVLGGLAGNDWSYFDKLYAAGARGYFDIANVHPYTGKVAPELCWAQAGTTRNAKDALCGIEEIRKSMVANGESAKPVWATEFGWSTYAGEYGVSETTQADYLTRAYKKLESWPWVQQAFWYSFRNDPWLYEAADQYNAHLGVTRKDFTPKPAFYALKTYAATASGDAVPPTAPAPAPEAPSEPTPPPVVAEPEPAPQPAPEPAPEPAPQPAPTDDKIVTDPTAALQVTLPAQGQFVTTLSASATVANASRVEFLLDGRRFATDKSAPYAVAYSVASKLSYGDHALTVKATRRDGTVVSVRTTVRRMRALTASAASRRRACGIRTLRSTARRTSTCRKAKATKRTRAAARRR